PPESDLQCDIEAVDDTIQIPADLFTRYGDIYRFYSPARRAPMWVINHPDDVKRVLVSNHKNYTKGIGLDRVKILLGNGIMTSEGELWKRQRYMMQPYFHRRVITRFAGLINDCNDRFIARWEAQAEAKLHAEVDLVGELASPSLADLETLAWTRNVCDEALRLYPPGWLLSRRAIEPDVLSGYPVPAGANLLLCLYLLHRHPRYW